MENINVCFCLFFVCSFDLFLFYVFNSITCRLEVASCGGQIYTQMIQISLLVCGFRVGLSFSLFRWLVSVSSESICYMTWSCMKVSINGSVLLSSSHAHRILPTNSVSPTSCNPRVACYSSSTTSTRL